MKEEVNYNDVEIKAIPVAKKGDSVDEVKPKNESVVSGAVKMQKKGIMERLVIGVLGPDGLPSIGSYLGKEIVMPAIKNIIVDSFTSGINMMMFGGEQRRNGQPPTNYGGPSTNHWSKPTTNYGNSFRPTNVAYSTPTSPTAYAKPAPLARRDGGNRVDDYIISDRHEALNVMDTLMEQATQYGSVSVADYYDLIAVEPRFTDNTYGWVAESIATASVMPVRNGFIIKLPPVTVI